jgi:hypothetical protein
LCLASLALACAVAACDETLDAIDGDSFNKDECVSFKFFQSDTVLVKSTVIPAEDEGETDDDGQYCRQHKWRFKDEDDWMVFDVGTTAIGFPCDYFSARLTNGSHYYLFSGTHFSETFAEGNWTEKDGHNTVVTGGTFEFQFTAASCGN